MKIDPRVRLFEIIALTTLAVLSKDVFWLCVLTLTAFFVCMCYKINIFSATKRLKHFLWLILFIAIAQSLTIKGGVVLLHIKSINILTSTGLRYAIEFMLRMSIIILAGLIAAQANGREMTEGMIKLGLPYEFAFMSSIALRYIPVFRDEFVFRMNAIELRGIDIKKLSLHKKLKLYAYLISPTVSGCILKSAELAKSMESRGFRAEKHRSSLRELKMTKFDWLIFTLTLLYVIVFLFCMNYFGTLITF